MKNKLGIKCLTVAALISSFAGVVHAASPSYNIDPDQKGSITIYKHVSEDGKYKDGTFQEQQIDDVTTKGIQGVGFKYVSVGHLIQIPSNNLNNVGLYYTLNQDFVDALGDAGVVIQSIDVDGRIVYTAESVNKALKEINTQVQDYDNTNDASLVANEKILNYINTKGVAMPDTDENGKTTVGSLEQGLYIVGEYKHPTSLPDGETQLLSKPSAPFLMPIPTTNIAELNGAPAGTVWQYDLVAYPKSEMIVVRKDIIADGNDTADGDATNGLVQQTDKNVGDTVDFLLTLDVPALQPQTNGVANTNRKFIVSDTMTDGLTIDDLTGSNFEVKYGQAQYNGEGLKEMEYNVDYTVTDKNKDGGRGFTLTLTREGLAKFDALTVDSKLYIKYTARINSNAVVPADAIKEEGNEYTLTYGTSTSKDHLFESNKDIKTYTYEVNIKKEFTHEVTDMSAVTFQVYHINEDGSEKLIKFIKEDDGNYHIFDNKEEHANITDTVAVDAKGALSLKGLDNGKYSIKEITTIPGYNVLRDPIILTINADNPENGKVTSSTIQSGKSEINVGDGLETGCVNFKIINNETISALHTGGAGWGMLTYLIGGVSLAGGTLLITKNRKKEEE